MTFLFVCEISRAVGQRWTDLRQIHREDVFGPSLGWVWMSGSNVKGQGHQGRKTAFFAGPFRLASNCYYSYRYYYRYNCRLRHTYGGTGAFHAKPANASNRYQHVDYDNGTCFYRTTHMQCICVVQLMLAGPCVRLPGTRRYGIETAQRNQWFFSWHGGYSWRILHCVVRERGFLQK